MSLRGGQAAAATAAAVNGGRLRAVLSAGVSTGVSTFTLPGDARDLMLLSSGSFYENFKKISAYCSAQKSICDMSIWKRLIAQHSVPLLYVDADMGLSSGLTIEINDASTATEVAAYLEVVASTVSDHATAMEFTRDVLEVAPGFARSGDGLPVWYNHLYDDLGSFESTLETLSVRQGEMYAVQLKVLEFVISQHGTLGVENYRDRSIVKNSLVKAVLNYNLDVLEFVWTNFVKSPASFRNGDLGERLFKAVNGVGDRMGPRWQYKYAAYDKMLMYIPGIWAPFRNDSYFQTQLQHATVAVWALEKVLANNFELRELGLDSALEAARARVREGMAMSVV